MLTAEERRQLLHFARRTVKAAAAEVRAATAALSGTLNTSMGCHGGYSVPDAHASTRPRPRSVTASRG